MTAAGCPAEPAEALSLCRLLVQFTLAAAAQLLTESTYAI